MISSLCKLLVVLEYWTGGFFESVYVAYLTRYSDYCTNKTIRQYIFLFKSSIGSIYFSYFSVINLTFLINCTKNGYFGKLF